MSKILKTKDYKICIIGLGYVGLPLASAFAKKFYVKGYDQDNNRIDQLQKNFDNTNQLSKREIKENKILFINNIAQSKNCNVFIVTVPTPIKNRKPDLSFVISATKKICKVLKKKDILIFESTVYPGVTEDICGKIVEKEKKFKVNKDFFLGYSPERINPSDKKRTIYKIKKVVSGSNKRTLDIINFLYNEVIPAGTFKASSIKVAEGAKVIENAQRDLNIAFVNEISLIFNKLNINFSDVLKAASTKWNFLNFKPGLVGGHCIGVDPYYLTYISKKNNYNPKLILSGRNINDNMSKYIALDFLKKHYKQITFKNRRVLIFGYTFKENCNDIRNTKVKDLVLFLKKKGVKVDVWDPLLKNQKSKEINFLNRPKKNYYDQMILAVPHKIFLQKKLSRLLIYGKKDSKIYDFKHALKDNIRVIKL